MSEERDLETCLAPLRDLQPPAAPLPAGACDSHAHVIGPLADYPLTPARSYEPALCPPAAYDAMLDHLGLGRGVLVQPSVYGTDNRLCLETVSGDLDRLRAVVVVDPEVSDRALKAMHLQGARGFRLNLLFGGGVGLAALERLAAKTAALGWHAQLLIDLRGLAELRPRIEALPVPVVFDHMGHFPAELGTDWEGFAAMVELARAGKAWIKVSGAYRLAAGGVPHDAVRPLAEALFDRVPERLVWGSDWPHVGLSEAMPDTGALLNEFLAWCPDEALRARILRDNPVELYGFA